MFDILHAAMESKKKPRDILKAITD